MRTYTSIYKQLSGIEVFIGTRYWLIFLLTASFYSCSNIQTTDAVELSEIEVIDRVIFYEGQKYNGVVYHVRIDPNRNLFNVDSPIKIKGVPIEISRYIDYAFTVVDGKINGPATSTFNLRSMENISYMFLDEKEIVKEVLGLSFNTNIVSVSNIYGVSFNENIKVYNSRGNLIYSLDNKAFMENCWISSDDIIIRNSGKGKINILTGKISKDDDIWIGSYSIGKKRNGEWEVIVNEYNRITKEERIKVGGLELRPEASSVTGLGDFYNCIALRLITGVY